VKENRHIQITLIVVMVVRDPFMPIKIILNFWIIGFHWIQKLDADLIVQVYNCTLKIYDEALFLSSRK
jgi:hypothetical protein